MSTPADNVAAQFRDAIGAAGLPPPGEVFADGALHRFATNGRAGDDGGWYVLHPDGIPAGAFGDWRTSLSETWRADIGRRLTAEEKEAHRRRLEEIRRAREAEEVRRHVEAKERAATIWNAATPATDDHPYLARKSVSAYGLRVDTDGRLIVPLRDNGELHSLQFIDGDGDKLYLTGGRVKGCYHAIGALDGAAVLCIAEGYATGATIRAATGHPVVVAFNAGNLAAVAKAMRARFPELPLILCADDDIGTNGNPGLTKATEAARAVGGRLAVPDFGADRPANATDFNDVAALHDLELVSALIETAREVPHVATPEIRNSSTPEYERLTFTSVGALLAEPDAQEEWLVDGLLPAGGLGVIVGKPKAGKSTFARNLAKAVAHGEKFLGRAVQQGPVLYLALEEKRSQIKAHFRALGIAPDAPLKVFVGASPDDGLAQLTAALEQASRRDEPVALVVIDPLFRFIRVRGVNASNDYGVMTAALDPVLALAHTSGACVLSTHHAPKGERADVDAPIGSTAIAGSVDVMLVLKRTERYRTLSTVQRTGNDMPDTVLLMDAETRTIRLAGTRQEADEAAMASEIIAYVGAQPEPVEEKAIQHAVEGRKQIKVTVLRNLIRSGNLNRSGEGKRGDPYRYTVSGSLVPSICLEPQNQIPESEENPHQCSVFSGSASPAGYEVAREPAFDVDLERIE